MGFAASPATKQALAVHGIHQIASRWKWAPGAKGLAYPPHQSLNAQVRASEDEFDAQPGHDLNGEKCLCWIVPVYQGPDGKIAKAVLQPTFLPPGQRVARPVTAAVEVFKPEPIRMEPLDLEPLGRTFAETLADALARPQPINLAVTIPDGAVVVNVTTPAPTVNVQSPTVQVDAPTVNVEAPTVNIEPAQVTAQIDVKPAPVKVIREKVAKRVRFRRGADGKIDEAEVTG